jgi:hypothetical protein
MNPDLNLKFKKKIQNISLSLKMKLHFFLKISIIILKEKEAKNLEDALIECTERMKAMEKALRDRDREMEELRKRQRSPNEDPSLRGNQEAVNNDSLKALRDFSRNPFNFEIIFRMLPLRIYNVK